MLPLVNQPTAAMSRKQFYTLVAGGAVTVGFWLLNVLAHVMAPPEIVGTVVTLTGAAIGYYIQDRANI